MADHRRSRADDDDRIRTVTRWLVAGSLAATGAVGGLAAQTHASSSSSKSVSSVPSSDDNSFLSPSASAPQQSFEAPVAQSGGS